MLKIRRPLGRLIFNMGITIPGKTVFLIETAPCVFDSSFFTITFKVMALYSTEASFDTQQDKVVEMRWYTIAYHELSPINLMSSGGAYMRQWSGSSLIRVMACCLFGDKPFTGLVLTFVSWIRLGSHVNEILIIWKLRKMLTIWIRPQLVR